MLLSPSCPPFQACDYSVVYAFRLIFSFKDRVICLKITFEVVSLHVLLYSKLGCSRRVYIQSHVHLHSTPEYRKQQEKKMTWKSMIYFKRIVFPLQILVTEETKKNSKGRICGRLLGGGKRDQVNEKMCILPQIFVQFSNATHFL